MKTATKPVSRAQQRRLERQAKTNALATASSSMRKKADAMQSYSKANIVNSRANLASSQLECIKLAHEMGVGKKRLKPLVSKLAYGLLECDVAESNRKKGKTAKDDPGPIFLDDSSDDEPEEQKRRDQERRQAFHSQLWDEIEGARVYNERFNIGPYYAPQPKDITTWPGDYLVGSSVPKLPPIPSYLTQDSFSSPASSKAQSQQSQESDEDKKPSANAYVIASDDANAPNTLRCPICGLYSHFKTVTFTFEGYSGEPVCPICVEDMKKNKESV